MNKEQTFLQIISSVLSDSSYLGDDCAVLDDFGIVVTQDSLIEDVHFNLDFITPHQLGKKAVLVNISDILASGAKPKYLTISLSGDLGEFFIREFYSGVEAICLEYGVKVIGGDLTGGDKISLSICAIGDCRGRKISSRKNAKDSYIVAVCGVFGASAIGLKQLLSGVEGEFIKNHLEPKLFTDVSEKIALNCKQDYALMDSSDGLYDCLKQISDRSNVQINIEYEKIPHVDGDFNNTLFGGEDYCLVGCFSPSDFEKIDGLIKIGTVNSGKGIFVDGIEIQKDLSYEHFKN